MKAEPLKNGLYYINIAVTLHSIRGVETKPFHIIFDC